MENHTPDDFDQHGPAAGAQRLRLRIAYQGTRYSGWQIQARRSSVRANGKWMRTESGTGSVVTVRREPGAVAIGRLWSRVGSRRGAPGVALYGPPPASRTASGRLRKVW